MSGILSPGGTEPAELLTDGIVSDGNNPTVTLFPPAQNRTAQLLPDLGVGVNAKHVGEAGGAPGQVQ